MSPSCFCRTVLSGLVFATLSLTTSMTVAQPLIAKNLDPLPANPWLEELSPLLPLPSPAEVPEVMTPFAPVEAPEPTPQQADPLNSQYPVPWQWILETQTAYAEQQRNGLSYYRSPAIVSPSGQYAAYSRIEVRAKANLYDTKVLSVLFVENLETGELAVVEADSPIAAYLEKVGEDSPEMAGVISLLIPASWSRDGHRLLARQLEGAFHSSDISDHAVIWNSQTSEQQTLSAIGKNTMDSSATLLGWDQANPEQVLFKVFQLEAEEAPPASIISMGFNGRQQTVGESQVVNFGQIVSRSWTGIQQIH